MAYVFGNDGYEAFVTMAIALGLLLSWQLIGLTRLLFQSRSWLVIKFLGTLLIGFFWFISMGGVIMATAQNIFDPLVQAPPVNWLVVLVGTIPFLMPRIAAYRLNTDPVKALMGVLASLFSIIVLCVAVIGYFDNDAMFRDLILVLAVQLQYLMNHAINKTDYLPRSHAYATSLTRRLNLKMSIHNLDITLLIVGLPFFLPLIIISLISMLR